MAGVKLLAERTGVAFSRVIREHYPGVPVVRNITEQRAGRRGVLQVIRHRCPGVPVVRDITGRGRMSTPAKSTPVTQCSVRPMQAADHAAARGILHLAFGTFLGTPDPSALWADKEYVATRWRANPGAALVAEADGAVVGSNFAANWGSFGFFGPLTVHPQLWNRGVAQSLLGSTMDLFESWGLREAGLFTFAHSPRHVHLYQKFGFWPRFLTAIMEKPVGQPHAAAGLKYSELTDSEKIEAVEACRALTGSIFEGLNVEGEIRSVYQQNLGETVLLWGGDRLAAFAVCHCGEGTEAGAHTCYVKFGAVSPAAPAEKTFAWLLAACEALAAEQGLERLEAGVNLGRSRAYRTMLQQGFRTAIQGVALQRPDAPGYNRPDVFAVDDWR
jgi:GNAT superfamily N-acetyltransferase